eukprot:gene32760-43785_t
MNATTAFSSSMKPMERPSSDLRDKGLKNAVATNTNPKSTFGEIGKEAGLRSGITFSIESIEKEATVGALEFEVLKNILNRESYLNRLIGVSKSVGRKYKPEVTDILDLIRASSMDVVEAIVKWREGKDDHTAAFMWDGINYLLKMPSDLDYLDKYLAIKKWLGFSIVRNPFCVPFGMDGGKRMHTEKVVNPSHGEKGGLTEGFAIGGVQKKWKTTANNASSSNLSVSSTTSSHSNSSSNVPKAKSYGQEEVVMSPQLLQAAKSFVLNEDMLKIRQAEQVILAEEDRFGSFCRDPEGRLMPEMQALTTKTALELRKDDRRSMTEPSKTVREFAPHAAVCEVGVAQQPWTPDILTPADLAIPELRSKYVTEVDASLDVKKKGQKKIGGMLTPIEARGAESRQRRPLKTNLPNEMEFVRKRELRTLGEKLDEINQLREEIEREKLKQQSQ